MTSDSELTSKYWRRVPVPRLTEIVLEAFGSAGYSVKDIAIAGRSRFITAMRSEQALANYPPYLEVWSVADVANVFDEIERRANEDCHG